MSAPSLTAVVCTYSEQRWPLLQRALESLRQQMRTPDHIVLVVDHNEALRQRACPAFPDVQVVSNDDAPGLAGARNTGVSAATDDVVVFLDDDAFAEPRCLEYLLAPYTNPRVMGAGGAALPVWPLARPRWLPAEFDWVVGCSYTGLPAITAPVRNPIGACMSFRRSAFERAGVFTTGMGRTSADAMGCEETEFSIRLQQAVPGSMLVYVPQARVRHSIASERTRWRYFMSRCFAEGRSKARVARSVGSRSALATERAYTTRVLPSAALRGLEQGLKGETDGLLRTTAIGAGLAATTAGYVGARLGHRRRGTRAA
jgi:GT2 family glycosyltransferase